MIEGDLTLLLAGVLAHYGLFSFTEAIVCGTLGGFTGDTIAYLIGLRSKQQIAKSRFYLRAQPQLERLSARFGNFSIFLVKYIYGLRTASAIFWGFAHMRFRRFAPLTLGSCAAWSLLLAGAGHFSARPCVLMTRPTARGHSPDCDTISILAARTLAAERHIIGKRFGDGASPTARSI
jgi:membrane protein DedA with SNARE-associated domain